MSADAIDEVVRFWFEELKPKDWFQPDGGVDGEIEVRFHPLYDELAAGVPESWLARPDGFLAAIIVLDQFPRNMFRGQSRAFATDEAGLALAKRAVDEGIDARLPPKQRPFIYLPFQHSEEASDQEKSVQLFTALGNPLNLDYALRHEVIIERFGRFPHRNAILGRTSTEEETAFLQQQGSSF
ncbi:MAG: DUF924 family protein [Methyloceanibacter sp.]